MKHLIFFSLISTALIISVTDAKASSNGEKEAQLGKPCGGESKVECAKELVCEARGTSPKNYAGICVPQPGNQGDSCGGGTLYAKQCKKGLECVVVGDKLPGKKGVCQKENKK